MDWQETLGIGVNRGKSTSCAQLVVEEKRKGIVVMQSKGG